MLAEDRRKEIFLALVAAQDDRLDVARSRRVVAKRFGVTERQVREIEREGLNHQWPPLGDDPAPPSPAVLPPADRDGGHG
jgi:hypothetical protein